MSGSPQAPKKRILAQRYALHEIAGKGGMGVVWRAWDESVQRGVAIKLVLPAHTDHEQEQRLARIRRERDVLIELSQHPNIVTLFDVLTEPLGYVMEWLHGFNIEQWLELNPGPQRLETIAAIFGPVLDAVGYAHDRGVVHRDLKSSNIFLQVLGDRATVRVMDYGLARIVEQQSNITTGRLIVGTPQYMAPEQVLGNTCTPQTDIYALGVLLFECITGELPIEAKGDSPIPMLVSKVNQELPRPRTVKPDLPEALDDVVARATARLPEERFSSCEEFAEALFAAIPDLPRSARSSIDVSSLGVLPAMSGEISHDDEPSDGFVAHTVPVDRELFGEAGAYFDAAQEADTQAVEIDGVATQDRETASAAAEAISREAERRLAASERRAFVATSTAPQRPFLSKDTRDALRTIQRNAVDSAKRSTNTLAQRLHPRALQSAYYGLEPDERFRVTIVIAAILSVVSALLLFAILGLVSIRNAERLDAQREAEAVFPETENLPDDAPLVEDENWTVEGNTEGSNVRGALRTYERVIEHWNEGRSSHVIASHRSPMRCYYNELNFPREELPQNPVSRAILGRPQVPIVPQRIIVTSSGRDFVTFVEEGVAGENKTAYTRMIQMAGSNRTHWLVSVEVSRVENRCFDRFDAQWAIWRSFRFPETDDPIMPDLPPPVGTIIPAPANAAAPNDAQQPKK